MARVAGTASAEHPFGVLGSTSHRRSTEEYHAQVAIKMFDLPNSASQRTWLNEYQVHRRVTARAVAASPGAARRSRECSAVCAGEPDEAARRST